MWIQAEDGNIYNSADFSEIKAKPVGSGADLHYEVVGVTRRENTDAANRRLGIKHMQIPLATASTPEGIEAKLGQLVEKLDYINPFGITPYMVREED